jgi:hypothetical protein
MLWDAFRNTDDEGNLGGNGFFDTGRGKRRPKIGSTKADSR